MKNGKRILAWIGILVIAALFIALVFFTLTGAPANVIMAILFCLIVIPVLFYAYQMILKVIKERNQKK